MVTVARTRLRRAAARAAAVVAVAVIAGGCTAQHGGGGTPRPASQSVAGSPGGGPPPPAAKNARADAAATRIPLKVPNSVTARKAVTLAGCTAASAGGQATGTVTAPRAAAYSITVFFTTSKATVVGYATTTVHATSGRVTPWQASGHFRAPHGMRCVLRGVYAR